MNTSLDEWLAYLSTQMKLPLRISVFFLGSIARTKWDRTQIFRLNVGRGWAPALNSLLSITDWLKGLLLVSRSGLVEENTVEVFHHVFTCPLLPWCKISSPFKQNNNVAVLPFPFHIVIPFVRMWFVRIWGYFPILMTSSFPDLYPLIRPHIRSLALCRGRILIPGFVQSPHRLAVYGVAHYLPLGGIFRSQRMRLVSLLYLESLLHCRALSYRSLVGIQAKRKYEEIEQRRNIESASF